jgi:hypothetical protein
MVIMFFFFGYQKWFPYEFERLVPFISNGPLIWWLLVRMHPFIRRRLARLGQLEPILTHGHRLPRFALRLSRGLRLCFGLPRHGRGSGLGRRKWRHWLARRRGGRPGRRR